MAFGFDGQLSKQNPNEPGQPSESSEQTGGQTQPSEAEQAARVSERAAAEADCGGAEEVAEPGNEEAAAPVSGDVVPLSKASEPESRGLFVTPPAYFSEFRGLRVLSHGIDTLYLSLSVIWGKHWPRMMQVLEAGKRKATGTPGIPFADGRCLVLPSGRPGYRWHLQFPGFHVFLSKQPKSFGDTPNVYVCLGSEILWKLGIRPAVALVQSHLQDFGGTVEAVKVSRCDPCFDFLVPGGLTLSFLQTHLVPRHRDQSHYQKGDILESFYVGARGAPIQLRLYDKGTEILLHAGSKLWFLDIWKLADSRDVWRCEFQLRRPALKAFQIDSLDDLEQKLGGLWKYLTEDWVSLRRPDDENATRRSVHPLWETIQQAASLFGNPIPLVRSNRRGEVDASWYVKQVAAFAVGFGVERNLSSRDECMAALMNEVQENLNEKTFTMKFKTKQIQKGLLPENGEGGNHVGN